MKNYLPLNENDFCDDNHANHYYDPSIDAYVCPTCESISPANFAHEYEEEIDDEYEHYIGI